ncbi:MAG: DUF3291 domain-containing protein [Anaerolineaceae bacterium]|nr:DUF3291 domain-containing protein [Anaerolineaceae bacterium]
MTYHIAQINIARMIAPLDSPIMRDFVDNLGRINALAETAHGFVWRLKGDGNDATSLRPYEDERIIVNMSVWESVDALFQYAYYSDHTDFFRRRKEWFHKMDTPAIALWWIDAGHIPTVDEAKEKLALIEQHGVTPAAFTFKQRFTVEEMLAV